MACLKVISLGHDEQQDEVGAADDDASHLEHDVVGAQEPS